MGDESLSMAYDMEGIADDEAVASQIERFVSLIESTVEEANTALNSNILFEVLSIQSSLKDSINEVNSLYQSIKQAPELADSEEVSSMSENLSRFKQALVGNGNAIEAKLASIKLSEATQTRLEQASIKGQEARRLLVRLNNGITEYTKVVEDKGNDRITTSKSITSILALITIALSAVIAYLVTQAISQPLKSAVKQIQQAATGDMTVHFKKFRDDELGEMADNMQILLDNLRATLTEIKHNSDTLASTAEQTTAISDHSFSNISRQNEQIQMMSTSIEEMTATVESVAGSIHQALDYAERANQDAQSGESLLATNVDNIHELEVAIKESSDVIARLNQETNDITNVLNEIRGVAEQTNLLALNAAIEAARAGEQGRGFAVVADEVRTLASRAHDSTTEVQEAIERLQRGARSAVETMEQSQKETAQCVEGIGNVQQMLSAIVGGIATIRDMSQQIATAAEEQSVASQSQCENIIQIKDISEETAMQARENQEASKQLAEMAENQRAMVSKFKT